MKLIIFNVGNAADFFQILIRQNRLCHFQTFDARCTFKIEQIGPRADKGDQRHNQLLANRVNRRIGDLREKLFEIGVKRL